MQLKTEEMQYILLTFVCRPSGRLFFITIMITSMIIVIIIIVFLANFRAPHTKHTHNKHPTQAQLSTYTRSISLRSGNYLNLSDIFKQTKTKKERKKTIHYYIIIANISYYFMCTITIITKRARNAGQAKPPRSSGILKTPIGDLTWPEKNKRKVTTDEAEN